MITLEIHITARWLLAFRDAATPSIRLIAICFLQSFSLPVVGLGRWRNRQDSVGGKTFQVLVPVRAIAGGKSSRPTPGYREPIRAANKASERILPRFSN